MKALLTIPVVFIASFSFGQLTKIPEGEFKSFDALKDTIESPLLHFAPFEISNELTFKEYRDFLENVENDTNIDKSKCFLDNDALPDQLYQEFLYLKKFENRPLVGISWEGAMEFCKWKTIQENDSTSQIKYLYRLPLLSEWLYALHLGSKLPSLKGIDDGVSEWTYNAKDESHYSNDFTWSDYTYDSKPNDPRVLRRKIVIGNSSFIQYDALHKYLDHSYYEFKGYAYVGFRYVKVKISEETFKKSNRGTYPLEYWILSDWKLLE